MANKKRKGLGQGIGALFPDAASLEEEVDRNDERVVMVPLKEIRPNPYQPRTHFDEEALQELSDSIKETGVLQPIILRKSSVKGFEIIAGERRVRASRLADLETIPAIVREVDEEVMMQVAILENLQREDLTALEEADAYYMMMEKLSMTQEKVAERLGKSRSYISKHLRLRTMPNDVKDLLQNGSLSMGQSRTILGLKDKKRVSSLAKRAVKEELTVRQLEQLVADANNKQKAKSKKPAKKKSVFIRNYEEKLTDMFGTKVDIREKGPKGKIEIEYTSQDDLARILEDVLDVSLD